MNIAENITQSTGVVTSLPWLIKSSKLSAIKSWHEHEGIDMSNLFSHEKNTRAFTEYHFMAPSA
jgi:hypothetical protein